MNVIETQSLTKRYGDVLAIDAVTFAVEQGQVFGFLGPNGSGKTTTIGMLLGIITPTAGTVRLLGLTGRQGLHEARQKIGATLETPNFYPYLSGWDNLRIVANLKRVELRRVEETLEVALRMLRMRRILLEQGDGFAVSPSNRELLTYYANSIAHLLGPFRQSVMARDSLPAERFAAGVG